MPKHFSSPPEVTSPSGVGLPDGRLLIDDGDGTLHITKSGATVAKGGAGGTAAHNELREPSGTGPIPNATWQAMPWEVRGTGVYHDNDPTSEVTVDGGNNTRILTASAGIWVFSGYLGWSPNVSPAAGSRFRGRLTVDVDGMAHTVENAMTWQFGESGAVDMFWSGFLPAGAAHTVEVWAEGDTGSTNRAYSELRISKVT